MSEETPDEQIAKLRNALEDAVDLAEEAMTYVNGYYIEKWDMVKRLETCKAALK